MQARTAGAREGRQLAPRAAALARAFASSRPPPAAISAAQARGAIRAPLLSRWRDQRATGRPSTRPSTYLPTVGKYARALLTGQLAKEENTLCQPNCPINSQDPSELLK